MNDDFADLETELRSLQPLRPGVAFEERLAQAFAASATVAPVNKTPWWRQLGFHRPLAAFTWGLATPAAAVCAVLLLHVAGGAATPRAANSTVRPPLAPLALAPATSGGFEPAAASDVLYQTNDEGVVYDAQQQPARQVRYLSHETLAWRNPHTGTQVEVSYPREEVVLTPISLR
jgi:hypothetical protein